MSEQSDPGLEHVTYRQNIPEAMMDRSPTPHSVPNSAKFCEDEYGFLPCAPPPVVPASKIVTPYGGVPGGSRKMCTEYLCRTQSLGGNGVYVVVPTQQPQHQPPRLSVERLL